MNTSIDQVSKKKRPLPLPVNSINEDYENRGNIRWGDIETCSLTKVNLRRQILEDICYFHPKCEPLLHDLVKSQEKLSKRKSNGAKISSKKNENYVPIEPKYNYSSKVPSEATSPSSLTPAEHRAETAGSSSSLLEMLSRFSLFGAINKLLTKGEQESDKESSGISTLVNDDSTAKL